MWAGKSRAMTAKMLAATQKINASKQNQLKITRDTRL